MASWKKYQDDVAELFRRMGFDTEVEAKLVGARGERRIDIAVRCWNAGASILWIVECKLWQSPVKKEQVMTLGQIAQDVGADRALAFSGFFMVAGERYRFYPHQPNLRYLIQSFA